MTATTDAEQAPDSRSVRRFSVPRLTFPQLWVALAICFGVLISIIASIYPAGLASRLSIVRALQHE